MDELFLDLFRTGLNCTINFCFCLAIILLVIKLFNVKNPHLKYFLFLIPLIKLWYDGAAFMLSGNFCQFEPLIRRPLDLCFSAGLGSSGISLWSLIFTCAISRYAYSFGDIMLAFMGSGPALILVTLWISISICLVARRYISWAVNLRELESSLIECPGQVFYLSARAESPMVMGVVSPKIIVPLELHKKLSPGELSLIVEHEKNHISRMDNIINHITAITKDIFFFIPPLHYLVRHLFLEREKICDRLAIGEKIENALQLSKAMLKVAESQVRPEGEEFLRILPAANLYDREDSELFTRVTDILSCPGETNGIFRSKFAYMVVALIILKILIGASFFASSGVAETYASLAMTIIVSA